MSFREQLNAVAADPAARSAGQSPTDPALSPSASDAYKLLKERMHLKLLDRFDLAALETLKPEVLRQEISLMVGRLLQEEPEALNDIERRTLIRDIQHEMLGFGPIELLMADPTVSDILINSHEQIYVERKAGWNSRTSVSPTRSTCCASSTRSSRWWGVASTSPAPWSMRGCRTARASMR